MSDEQRTDEHSAQTEPIEQQLAPTMPSPDEIVKQPLSEEEIAARHAAWWKERQERAEALVNDSRRSWAAMQGWDAVTTQAEWDATMDKTVEEWHSGALFIRMLGGERYLDPPRTALMYHLWHHFVGTYRPQGPAEYLAIAMALFAFHQLIRVNEFTGNLMGRVEHQFFDTAPLTVQVRERDGERGRTTPEARIIGQEALAQVGRDALPLMDRLNRMVIRNLRALRDLQAAPLALNVGSIGQLNLGQVQTNVARPSETQPAGASEPIEVPVKSRKTRKRSV